MSLFMTRVTWLPAFSVLPGRWCISHSCRQCHREVRAEDLIAHAIGHEGPPDGTKAPAARDSTDHTSQSQRPHAPATCGPISVVRSTREELPL
jgi:hypothetical protein